jgi:RNA polymerase sigma factor (sigma-70 family)
MSGRTQIETRGDKPRPVMVGLVEPSDEKLVLTCRQGEAAAWSLLVNRYQRLIYTILRRAGLDEDQAAEVFQCTFAKLLEHLDEIEHPGRIREWLITTARYETLRLVQRQNTEQSISNFETVPGDDLLPDQALRLLEEQHLIRMAFAALDDRCRQLLTLLFLRPNPLPNAEIAAALDMQEGSLGPARARCLQRLRCLLEDAGL